MNFADITQSDFILLLIKLAAYILPFFLIPAAFKVGMGAFSTLTGMLNDRSRGFFDKQRKKRQGIYDYNKNRLSTGQRYNNRYANALTSRASTKRFGFTGQGRAAYQQKMAVAGAAFAKSEAGQALQHNDPALQALTYSSEAEARRMLGRTSAQGGFGIRDPDQINAAIAAAKASGGFGRDRQEWAAQQLAQTGTGYDDIDQVTSTIARVSRGNEGRAASLAGNINATTKTVGRPDLAPGFTPLLELSTAKMRGAQEVGGVSLEQAHRQATFDATGSVDAMTTMRSKTPGFQRNTVAGLQHGLSSGDPNAVRDATARVHDLINTMSYGPQPNQQALIDSFQNDERFAQHIQLALQQQRQGRGVEDRDRPLNP